MPRPKRARDQSAATGSAGTSSDPNFPVLKHNVPPTRRSSRLSKPASSTLSAVGGGATSSNSTATPSDTISNIGDSGSSSKSAATEGMSPFTESSSPSMPMEVEEADCTPPSPAESIKDGRVGWKRDFELCKLQWGKQGEVEGYVGMTALVKNFTYGEGDDSIRLTLSFEDLEARAHTLTFVMVFEALETYPKRYELLLFSEKTLSARAAATFTRFTSIRHLTIRELVAKILSSLQGDDEATGNDGLVYPGESKVSVESDEAEGSEMGLTDTEEIDEGFYDDSPGRGFEVAKGSELDLGKSWGKLKEHFAQGVSFGYRPGLSQISNFWVISYSIPLKSLAISPNTLAMWDDALVTAWRENKRFTLLMAVETYPPHLDRIKYWLTLDTDYKPSEDTVTSITRGHGAPFYLSSSLSILLKSFPRAYKIREAYGFPWSVSDKIGLDPELSHKVMMEGEIPENVGEGEVIDPMGKGFGQNLELVAFHWTLRRFLEAAKYCSNCGLPVELPSLRPYVCDKPLCLYSFMSLGLGPSVEHVICTQPGVVDLLLSLAHAAANSSTRMDLPLHLHIMVPVDLGIKEPKLLDDLDGEAKPSLHAAPTGYPSSMSTGPQSQQRKALVYLIEALPKVSLIKEHLDNGKTLKQLDAPEGAIGVLRWVIGSCKAYLKETKVGEGVLNTEEEGSGSKWGHYGGPSMSIVRQFRFVVGSPEQENNFKEEIAKAQRRNQKCLKHPTLLAFHGSATERWHNILRTGLDFSETQNGRAYGHGVYFANEASTSMSSYARSSGSCRPNADFPISTATALVELVNVPETFVSQSPHYVVANTKQIKPFLLLVTGQKQQSVTDFEAVSTVKKAGSGSAPRAGKLYEHDPELRMLTTFYGQPLRVKMPEKLSKELYTDTQENDTLDAKILASSLGPIFTPSPKERYDRIELLPPPNETSTSATRLLGREFKGIVDSQLKGGLPFWIDPETDVLYRWILELYDFPESQLRKDLKKYDINSVITELRFPPTYPHSPPFVRILHPRFMRFADGGGGHITAGGSICHELLSTEKWNPAYSIEAVIRDVMVNMVDSSPPAKLDPRSWDQPYGMSEAIEAFKRVSQAHGWAIPKDFDKFASAGRRG